MFIGPPFNALPLSHLIDYSDVGMVFNITGPTPWIELYEPKILELPTDASASSFSKPLKIIQVGHSCWPMPSLRTARHWRMLYVVQPGISATQS